VQGTESDPGEEQRDSVSLFTVAVVFLTTFCVAYILGTVYFIGEDWRLVAWVLLLIAGLVATVMMELHLRRRKREQHT
jgi:hypothetical protein